MIVENCAFSVESQGSATVAQAIARAAPDAKPGVQLIAFDITRDGVRQGELFDAVLEVQSAKL